MVWVTLVQRSEKGAQNMSHGGAPVLRVCGDGQHPHLLALLLTESKINPAAQAGVDTKVSELRVKSRGHHGVQLLNCNI